MLASPRCVTPLFMIACLLSITTGCASVATTDSTANADARKFQPDPGMAGVYLCRGSGVFGDTLVAQTQLDGLDVGSLAPNTYLLLSVAPGHHTLGTVGPTNAEQLDLTAVAGNVYFYNVSIDWAGPMIRHRHIQPLSDADGRKAVNSENRAVAATTNP
jgi:hypothetical protein